MPRWSKAVLRTVGALDIALSLCGLYLLYASVWGGVFALKASADAPYFKIAFEAMTATNGVVLTLFLLAGFQLLWLGRSGVMVHTTTSAVLIVYDVLIAIFWATGGRVGMSIAAATGVGNMGIAPFQGFNLARTCIR